MYQTNRSQELVKLLSLAVVLVQTATSAFAQAPQLGARNQLWGESADMWVAYATIALAFITLLLAIFTGLLFYATVKLASEAKANAARQAKETADSLEIATKSADAVLESNSIAKDVMARQLRAYVVVRAVHVVTVNAEPWFRVRVENFGNVPARFLQLESFSEFDEAPIEAMSFEGKDVHNIGLGVLAPRDCHEVDCPFPVEEVSHYPPRERERMFILGRLTYNDGFSEGRVTSFQFWRETNLTTVAGELMISELGNDAL